MSGLRQLLLKPIRLVIDRVERLVKRKLAGLIDACLEPVRDDLKVLNAKMDQILDINIAPEVLQDFRTHNETLRAIQADCDLVREMNPMFNSFLRELTRLQLECEEMSWRLEQRERTTSGREREAA
ncbi:MAG: hypothetical protein JWN86_1052 [Planctomycetota bacterium]|nr:hypothetical protein [Planctomycetota bacterium]